MTPTSRFRNTIVPERMKLTKKTGAATGERCMISPRSSGGIPDIWSRMMSTQPSSVRIPNIVSMLAQSEPKRSGSFFPKSATPITL